MSEAIKDRNRLALAALELAKDKNYLKLSEAERARLIKNSLEVGEEVAVWVRGEYGTSDPRELAEKVGLKILGAQRGGARYTEYRKNEKEIVIFREAFDHLTKQVTLPDLSERIMRILIAHELFHHLEETKIGPVYKRFEYKGPWWSKWYVKSASEVAAQSFVQTILGIEISPQVFDYLIYMLFTSELFKIN